MKGQVKEDIVFCMAEGKSIKKMENNMYLIDDQYYVRTADAVKVETIQGNQKGLIAPIKGEGTLEYTLVW